MAPACISRLQRWSAGGGARLLVAAHVCWWQCCGGGVVWRQADCVGCASEAARALNMRAPCVRRCIWYAIAIAPLVSSPSVNAMQPWLWREGYGDSESAYDSATLYVCSLYWALSVMTNLKGINAHESRQCFWADPLVTHPLEERVWTIGVFLFGGAISRGARVELTADGCSAMRTWCGVGGTVGARHG